MEKTAQNADANSGELPDNRHFGKFVMKEVLDKIGFGFGSQQFVNVLLFLSGASIFLVGVVNGIKTVLSVIASILAQEYNKKKSISKRVVGFCGIFFGFSFLFMAFGKFIDSPLVFSSALILGGISVVIYGDFSQNLFLIGRKKEILGKIAKYGLIITAASLLLSAFILDKYHDGSFIALTLLGKSIFIKIPGYLLAFEIAALSFIFSGYFLSSAADKAKGDAVQEKSSFSGFVSDAKQKFAEILKNRFLAALIIFNVVIGIVQTIGNSYYGIFIYQNFKNSYFGGFLNIAVVFLIGVFSSLIGYFIAKINIKSYGKMPMLAIGGLFLSSMPYAYYIGGNLALLTAGTILGVIGSSAIGIAINMFVIDLMREQDRRHYYTFSGVLSIIPYLALVPVFAYVAQVSMNFLFLILSAALLISTIAIMLLHKLLRKEMSKTQFAFFNRQ